MPPFRVGWFFAIPSVRLALRKLALLFPKESGHKKQHSCGAKLALRFIFDQCTRFAAGDRLVGTGFC